jgi:hypothetical protein
MLGQCERARAGASMQQGRQRQGICVEMTSKEFCPYVGVGGSELDRGHPGVHAVQRGVPSHPGYVATHARRQGYTGV